MPKKKNPDDYDRYKAFQQWVVMQAELKGWDMSKARDRQTLANNYNAAREDGEDDITESAFRRLVSRGTAVNDSAISTIRRDTCRMVANGLLLDLNDVLDAAGYKREDAYNQIDELPGSVRTVYGRLEARYKQRVHDCITEAWEAQVADSSEK